MTTVRDSASVRLDGEIPDLRRGRARRVKPRVYEVEHKDVDVRVMRLAMRHVNGNISRIVPIDAVSVEILPEA